MKIACCRLLPLFIVTAAVAMGCASPRLHPIVKLPDGTVLRLESVTYGKQHSLKVRPAGWRGLFTATQFSIPTERACLVLWCSQPPAPSGGLTRLRYTVAVCDAHGCRFDSRSEGSSMSGITLWGRIPVQAPVLHDSVLDTFPRRGKTITMRFYNSSGPPAAQASVAELAVLNPVPGPFPQWKGEPYPITKRAGDVAVTLTRLQGLPGEGLGATARFHLTRNGRVTHDWAPVRIAVTDATGNTTADVFEDAWEIGDGELRFKGLCPYEPAWKLRVEIAPTAETRVAPLLRWTVRDVAVPKRNAIVRSTATTTQKGVTLELLGVAGAGNVEWSEKAFSSGSEPYVRLAMRPGNALRPALRATDDRGRNVVVSWSSSWKRLARSQWDFQLQIPPGARRLNLSFAVYKSRFVEFMARPQPPGGKRKS